MDFRWGIIKFATASIFLLHQRSVLNRKRITDSQICSKLVTKMQADIRRYVQVKKYQRMRSAVITMQTWLRGRRERYRYILVLGAATKIQAWVRKCQAAKNFTMKKTRAIKVQTAWRKKFYQTYFFKVRKCVVLIQSSFRRSRAIDLFHRTIRAMVSLQAIWRQSVCRTFYNHSRRRIVYLQSLYRRLRAVRLFRQAVKSVVAIQTTRRRHVARRRYEYVMDAVLLLQSFVRMARAIRRTKVKRYMSRVYSQQLCQYTSQAAMTIADITWRRNCARRVQHASRGHIQRCRFLAMKRACCRLQRCIRAFLRNLYLTKGVLHLYGLCSHGHGRDMEALLSFPATPNLTPSTTIYMPFNCQHIRQFLSIRNRSLKFCTPLHVAAGAGNLSVVQVLQPGPADILDTDSIGNNTAHFAVLHPSVDMFDYLANCLEVFYDKHDLVASGVVPREQFCRAVDNASPLLKHEPIPSDTDYGNDTDTEAGMVDAVLRQGWLQKVPTL